MIEYQNYTINFVVVFLVSMDTGLDAAKHSFIFLFVLAQCYAVWTLINIYI